MSTEPSRSSNRILENSTMSSFTPHNISAMRQPVTPIAPSSNRTGRMSQLTSLSLGTPDSPFEFPSPFLPASNEYNVERRGTRSRRFREPTPLYASDSTSSSDNFPDARIKVVNPPRGGRRSSVVTAGGTPWNPMSASLSVGGPTPTNLVFL